MLTAIDSAKSVGQRNADQTGAAIDRRLRGENRPDAGKAQEKRADRFRQKLFGRVHRSLPPTCNENEDQISRRAALPHHSTSHASGNVHRYSCYNSAQRFERRIVVRLAGHFADVLGMHHFAVGIEHEHGPARIFSSSMSVPQLLPKLRSW